MPKASDGVADATRGPKRIKDFAAECSHRCPPCGDSVSVSSRVLTALTRMRKRSSGRRSGSAVQLDVTVLDIWSADVQTQSFCAKLKVLMRWICPEEHAEDAMRNGADLLDTDWEPEWFPRLSIDSTTEKQTESVQFNAAKHEDGTVWITGEWILCIRVLEAYDLHAFPFDVQDLNIKMHIENAAMGLELRALPGIMKRGSHSANWWGGGGGEDEESPVRVEADGAQLPDFCTLKEQRDGGCSWLESPALYRSSIDSLHVVLLYVRNPVFYSVNYMLLLCAIATCALFGWAIELSDVSNRLAFDVTLLLTAVAFKQVLAAIMPPISYLTRLDGYALISLGFLLLATAMHAAIGYVIDDCDAHGDCTFGPRGFTASHAKTLDAACFLSYALLWLLSNALYLLSCFRRRWIQRRAFSTASAKKAGFVPAKVVVPPRAWYEDTGAALPGRVAARHAYSE